MKKKSLNFKLAIVVSILVMGSLIISYLGLTRMNSINDTMTHLIQNQVAKTMLVKDLRGLFYLQVIDQRNIILEESEQGKVEFQATLASRQQEMLKLISTYEGMATEEEKKQIHDFQLQYLKWADITQDIISFSLKNDFKMAFEIAKTKAAPQRKASVKIIDSIANQNRSDMDKESIRAEDQYKTAQVWIYSVSFVAIFSSVLVAFFVLSAVGKAIDGIISNLTENSEQVSSASREIATASEQLSQASTEQASSLEETVATLEELTSMVEVNATNAKEAARLSEATRHIASRGKQEIGQLVSSMENISQDSKKIEEIITVIDDIAFQTNLLALNAAVEAARAGEQGKGFAVVAEAVRTLAQRSSSAAKDIAELIQGSVQKIEQGSKQADQSGKVLNEIVDAIKKVSDLNAEIANASQEQSGGISQIGQAMNQLDQVTQVNASGSEEAAASAEELSTQASQLRQVVRLLSTTVRGGVYIEEAIVEKAS